MPVTEGHPAYRSMPCKFFHQTRFCAKGDECVFHHIDEDGTNHHEQNYPKEEDVEIEPEEP